jgi:predicted component of type VI protein secretion system
MPAQLVSLGDGPSILLDKPILLIGRHPECDIQIDSRKVSRRHCCIAQVSDYLVVRDLASTNGIRVNGLRVHEAQLHEGDEVTIGSFRYRITWEAVPAARKKPTAPPPVPVRRDTARSDPPENDIERLLEASEEPIPLDDLEEPESPPIVSPRKATAIDRSEAPAPPPASPPRQPAPAPAEDDSLVLPDHLDLLPGSDVYPKPS